MGSVRLALTGECSDAIVIKTPWFFEMRSLIAERPNLVPVGLGNNLTPVDLSLLLPNPLHDGTDVVPLDDDGSEIDEIEDKGAGMVLCDDTTTALDDGCVHGAGMAIDKTKQQAVYQPFDWDMGADVTTSGSEGVGVENLDFEEADLDVKTPAKRKAEVKAGEKKTSARPGTSTPAVRPEKKKAKSAAEKFSDIARMEEESVQKELDLKAMKVKGSSNVKIAKIEAQARLQMEKERTKATLAAKKMDQVFQLQMLELQQRSAQYQHFPISPPAGMSNLNNRYTHTAPQAPNYLQQTFDFGHASTSTTTGGTSSSHDESYPEGFGESY